jgi:hypothetical protein
MANMPPDHGGRGVSFWTTNLSTLLYGGRVGGGSPLEVESRRALCSCVSRAGYEAMAGRRGSSIVQYSCHR